MEFNPFYVGGSDDEEEGFNNNEIDRSENNESLNSLNNNVYSLKLFSILIGMQKCH